MTDLHISPIRQAQVPQAARVMANAFSDAPRYTYLLPDESHRRSKLPWYWQATIRAALHSGGVVHVAQDSTGSDVLGVTIWTPPGHRRRGVLTQLRSGMWAAPFRMGVPAWRRRRLLGPLLAALAPPQPCWHLGSIGVDPMLQRSGAGTALISHMLPRIDADGLPAFLDTSQPDNLGYYERFGFRVTAESALPNGIPLWGMTRQPGAPVRERAVAK